MEMATSLAMLSSGANTTFWFLSQHLSDAEALKMVRNEMNSISTVNLESGIAQRRVLTPTKFKADCPTLLAMFNNTLRFQSSVIKDKKVQQDSTI